MELLINLFNLYRQSFILFRRIAENLQHGFPVFAQILFVLDRFWHHDDRFFPDLSQTVVQRIQISPVIIGKPKRFL